MGKDKGNRTKNNAKPSSSARSAELLGNQVPMFFGLVSSRDGTKSLATNIPTSNEDLDTCLDVQFQLVFKKMIKKNGTTKVKALNIFKTFCNEADSEKVKSILPFWPRLYCQLSNDPEHRVREASHNAHKVIVGKVKKYLAPFLKEIVGPWYTSQFDTYAPAASAATAAFQEAFSPPKLTEAITYCYQEIVEHIIRNLTVSPTEGPLKNISAEDIEHNHRRILCSSLQAYVSYIQSVPLEHLRKTEELQKRLLSLNKFWNLSGHKEPMVRLSFFNALGSIIRNSPFLLEKETSSVTAAIINHLGEDDPAVLSADGVLHGLIAFPESWNNSNVEKQLMPKLLKILRSGGKGGSAGIFPYILPLISKISGDVIRDKTVFYSKLFESMRAGIENPGVNRSLSESRIVVATFIECLQYVIQLHKDDSDFVEKLVRDELGEAIKSRLAATSPPNQATMPFTYHLAQLLRSWHRSTRPNVLATSVFWPLLDGIFTHFLGDIKCHADADVVLKSHSDFMSILRNPSKCSLKNTKERVRFAAPDEEVLSLRPTKEVEVPEFDKNLSNHVSKMSKQYFDQFVNTGILSYLKVIVDLTKIFDPEQIFPTLAGSQDVFSFYTKLLELRIHEEYFVELSLSMLPCLNEMEQLRVLQSLLNDFSDSAYLLCQAMSRCKSAVLRSWFHDPGFSKLYLRLIDDYLTGKCGVDAGEVICGFLSPDLLISNDALIGVIEAMKSAITNNHYDRISCFVSSLPSEAYNLPIFEKFFTLLFSASCCQNGDEFVALFQTILTNVKRYRRDEDGFWLALAVSLSKELDIASIDIDHTVSIISKYIEITAEVDLNDICDSDEIESCSQFIVEFIRINKKLENILSTAKDLVVVTSEACADCSLQYLISKESCEDGNSSKKFDSDKSTDFDQTAMSASLEIYLKWMQLVAMLLKKIVCAYPRSTKESYFATPGRFYIEGATKPDVDDDDIIPMEVPKGVYEQYQEDVSIMSSVYSEEEYPDINNIDVLMDSLVLLLESTALFDRLGSISKEAFFYPAISSRLTFLKDVTRDVLLNLTVTEYESLYQRILSLSENNALWCLVRPELSTLINRKFSKLTYEPDNEQVLSLCKEAIENGFAEKLPNILRFVVILRHYGSVIPPQMLNATFIQLDDAMRRVAPSVDEQGSNLMKMSNLSLAFTALKNHFNISEENEQTQIFQEWSDVVESELWSHLFKFWIELQQKTMIGDYGPWVKTLGEAVTGSLKLLKSVVPPEDTSKYIKCCLDGIISSRVQFRLAAFQVLRCLLRDLVDLDEQLFQSNVSDSPADDDKGSAFSTVRFCDWNMKLIEPALRHTQDVVDALLSDFKIGDTCSVQPFTDAFSYTHTYLLIWCVLTEMLSISHAALRFQYTAWLRAQDHLQSLLSAVFKLMPPTVLYGDAPSSCSKLFEENTRLLGDDPRSEWLEQLACYVYRMCLQYMPVAVRDWWTESDHYVNGIVGRATSTHVSPILIATELKTIMESDAGDLQNITIQANAATHEVVASYTIDDAVMTVLITFPVNHPLGAMKVTMNSNSANAIGRRIYLYLAHRNGSVRDALTLLKSYLDKKFEGIEECEICYGILHGRKLEIPKQECKTCRRKFHSVCLYKWFHISNKSTCPHCRNIF